LLSFVICPREMSYESKHPIGNQDQPGLQEMEIDNLSSFFERLNIQNPFSSFVDRRDPPVEHLTLQVRQDSQQPPHQIKNENTQPIPQILPPPLEPQPQPRLQPQPQPQPQPQAQIPMQQQDENDARSAQFVATFKSIFDKIMVLLRESERPGYFGTLRTASKNLPLRPTAEGLTLAQNQWIASQNEWRKKLKKFLDMCFQLKELQQTLADKSTYVQQYAEYWRQYQNEGALQINEVHSESEGEDDEVEEVVRPNPNRARPSNLRPNPAPRQHA